MNDTDKYLFDLNGYIVIRGVFDSTEIKEANDAIDRHIIEAQPRTSSILRNTRTDSGLSGTEKGPRIDLGALLQWGEKDSRIFQSVLAHPRLVPYFHELLGVGYRMDHMPFAILQEKGSEGFMLHGGMVDVATGKYNPYLGYHCVNGTISNSLLACSVALSDASAGDGGFCVVRGSHKSNFAAPESMIHGDEYREFLHQPELHAGDVVLFSEATVHGALPWNADHQRRIALYRFAPATMAYGRSYHPTWPEDVLRGMTEAQRAVLQPPFNCRLDRTLLVATTDTDDDDGDDEPTISISTTSKSRQEEKKAHDRKVFKTTYF